MTPHLHLEGVVVQVPSRRFTRTELTLPVQYVLCSLFLYKLVLQSYCTATCSAWDVPRQGQETVLFCTTTPALESVQPLIQRVPAVLSARIKRVGREAD